MGVSLESLCRSWRTAGVSRLVRVATAKIATRTSRLTPAVRQDRESFIVPDSHRL